MVYSSCIDTGGSFMATQRGLRASTRNRTCSFIAAFMLSVLWSPSYAATEADNERLRRELIGTTSGLAAATAAGLVPLPFGGTVIEISALALDLATKSLAPEFETPRDFAVNPNVRDPNSPNAARCEYRTRNVHATLVQYRILFIRKRRPVSLTIA